MILDVSKRGALGSADDDVAFFLQILSFFIDHVFLLIMSFLVANSCIF